VAELRLEVKECHNYYWHTNDCVSIERCISQLNLINLNDV